MAVTHAMRNDAALNDICFTSQKLGWAVGDRGVIWHTADGGSTWHEQQSNTVCNLSGIYMLDDHRGWAVGGECQQGRAATRGIVLRTEDGGATWTAAPRLLLPSLAGVKFFDHDHGIAYGQSCAAAPSGGSFQHSRRWQHLAVSHHRSIRRLARWRFSRTRCGGSRWSGGKTRDYAAASTHQFATRHAVAAIFPRDAACRADHRLGSGRRRLAHDHARPRPQLANAPD